MHLHVLRDRFGRDLRQPLRVHRPPDPLHRQLHLHGGEGWREEDQVCHRRRHRRRVVSRLLRHHLQWRDFDWKHFQSYYSSNNTGR